MIDYQEFQTKYDAIVYAQEGKPVKGDKIESNEARMKLYYKRLKNYDKNTVFEAMEKACDNTEYCPKLPEILSALQEIKNPGSTVHNKNTFNTTFQWLQTIEPEAAKYYGHKLTDRREYNIILNKLKAAGIPDFVPMEECEGYQRFQEAAKVMFGSNSTLKYLGGRMGKSESDDSGEIDPRAEIYLKGLL